MKTLLIIVGTLVGVAALYMIFRPRDEVSERLYHPAIWGWRTYNYPGYYHHENHDHVDHHWGGHHHN